MKPTAIEQMVKAIEYEITLIPNSCVELKANYQQMLDKACQLRAQEAQEQKAVPIADERSIDFIGLLNLLDEVYGGNPKAHIAASKLWPYLSTPVKGKEKEQ